MLFKGVSYAVSPAQQATIATLEEWDKDWKYLCYEKWEDFGFKSQEEVKEAQIGRPFLIKVVDIKEFVPEKAIIKQTVDSYRYVFPIQVKDKVVSEIYTGLSDGKWETIMVGGSVTRVLYEVAAANKLAPEEINIVFLGTSKYLVFKSGLEEVAVKITENKNNHENQVLVFKQEVSELKQLMNREKENIDEYTGMLMTEKEQCLQQESWLKRLARFCPI